LIKKFARKRLPKLVDTYRKLFGKNYRRGEYYATVTLTDEEIKRGEYKQYLGGRATLWESRGAFQLFFLQTMGMTKNSKVLDIGCGPGRASKHLIGFLDHHNYCGIDYNADFIKAATVMAEENQLIAKSPTFAVVQDFDFPPSFDSMFDYAIVFSVLNHCNEAQKEAFFRTIARPFKQGGKVYISHTAWFDESYLKGAGVKLTNQFDAHDFDITKYGWNEDNGVFPIIELTVD
jgi:SAM-dependent methyltransferase